MERAGEAAVKLSAKVLGIKAWRQRMRAEGRCIECGKRAAIVRGRGVAGGGKRRSTRCRPHLDKDAERQRVLYHKKG